MRGVRGIQRNKLLNLNDTGIYVGTSPLLLWPVMCHWWGTTKNEKRRFGPKGKGTSLLSLPCITQKVGGVSVGGDRVTCQWGGSTSVGVAYPWRWLFRGGGLILVLTYLVDGWQGVAYGHGHGGW